VRLLGRCRSGEQFLCPDELPGIDDDLVIGCQHLVDRGEVTPAATHRVADDAEDHAEAGTDQQGCTDKSQRVGVVGEQEEDEPEEEPEPGATGCTGTSGLGVGELARDSLDGLEVIADDGQLLDRELRLRQAVDDRLRFEVGVVSAQHLAPGEARKHLTATRKWTLAAHPTILPREG